MQTIQVDRTILDAELAEWCRGQVGVRWEHRGRAPGQGVDCVGLPVCSLLVRGLPVVDLLDYSETPTASQLLQCVAQNCAPAAGPATGRLVLFWVRRPQHGPTHTGVMLNEREFVHARRGRGDGVVEVELLERWEKRIHSFWQYDLAWRVA